MIFPLLPLALGQIDGEASVEGGELQGRKDFIFYINKEDDVSSNEPDDDIDGKISELGESTFSVLKQNISIISILLQGM